MPPALLKEDSLEIKAQKLKVMKPIMEIFFKFLKTLDSNKFFYSQVNALTHNDMIHGNILWDIEKEKYQLIDFEYTGFNLLGADIINLCLESAYEYDTPKWPYFEREFSLIGSDDHMEELIRFYVAFLKLYLVRRGKLNGEDYVKAVPLELLKTFGLDLTKCESPFDKELHFLDSKQTKEFISEFSKSDVYMSVTEEQIKFIKR